MLMTQILDECARQFLPMPAPKSIAEAMNAYYPSGHPTPKQLAYYNALVEGKVLAPVQQEILRQPGPLTKSVVSTRISWLMALPWKPKPVAAYPTTHSFTPILQSPKIPQGYYAVVDPADSALKFYRVRRPLKGKWSGVTFLSYISGGNIFPMKNQQDRARIFSEILKDVTGALKRFGQEIGQCGHCRKQLTDAESRQFGIGPVCRKALGI